MKKHRRYPLMAICLSILIVATVHNTHAGISLHYEGTLKSKEHLAPLIEETKSYSNRHGWKWNEVNEVEGKRYITINDEEISYQGTLKGIVLFPHKMCEPINLIFDRNLFMQDSTKTQFAGAKIHIEIVELLKDIEERYSDLSVIDDSEYWETSDYDMLQKHIGTVNKMIKDIKAKNPTARGPVKLKNGLIVDVVE